MTDPVTPPTMTPPTSTTSTATGLALPAPRFQPIQLGFGLFLVAIGSSAFVSSLVGSPWPLILSVVLVAEGLLVLWLIRRNQRLLHTAFLADHGSSDGPDPILVAAALKELEEDEPFGFSPMHSDREPAVNVSESGDDD